MPDLREKVRRAVRRSPGWNWALSFIVPRYKERAIRRDTELVIEGYPRCANTFAVVAFRMAQPREVSIAHHLHSVGQVRRGVARGLPTLVLVREPNEAIVSFAVRRRLTDISWAVEEYLEFHRGIAKLGDAIMLAEFRDVTSDFGAVTRRLNARFHTSFGEFVNTEENVAACFQQIDAIEKNAADSTTVRTTHVARPTEERKQQKRGYEEQLQSPQLRPKLAEAARLFDGLCQAHGISAPRSAVET